MQGSIKSHSSDLSLARPTSLHMCYALTRCCSTGLLANRALWDLKWKARIYVENGVNLLGKCCTLQPKPTSFIAECAQASWTSWERSRKGRFTVARLTVKEASIPSLEIASYS